MNLIYKKLYVFNNLVMRLRLSKLEINDNKIRKIFKKELIEIKKI